MDGFYQIHVMAAKPELLHIAAVFRMIEKHGGYVNACLRLKDTSNPCTQLTAEFRNPKSELIEALLPVVREYPIMISIRETAHERKKAGLIAFDTDSTLVCTEIMNELARRKGCQQEMAPLTTQAMTGRDDFRHNFSRRVAMLRGLPLSEIETVSKNLPIVRGLPSLMGQLKKRNIRTAIVSGGFRRFSESIKDRYGFDYLCTSEAEIKDGRLTGRLCGRMIDAEAKASYLQGITKELMINPSETVTIGDGANDIPMLSFSGQSILFNTSAHPHHTPQVRIDSILRLLSLKDSD